MIAPKWFYLVAGACIELSLFMAALHEGAIMALGLLAAFLCYQTAEYRTEKE